MKRYQPRVPKPTDLVCIEFLDHTETDESAVIEVVGRVRSINRQEIVVVSWDLIFPKDKVESETLYTILRSTIKICSLLQKLRPSSK